MEDQYILNLIQTGSDTNKGFRLLMLKYQERIYWHVRKMVWLHDDANDVVQNVFIKAFKGIGRFEGKSQIYTWLYRIASNEAITFLNKRKKLQGHSIDDDQLNLANTLHADSFFDGNKAMTKLHEALVKLPNKQRLVFNLRYFDEMSYNEMSEVLETSVGALKASFHHALKKIEGHLKEVETF